MSKIDGRLLILEKHWPEISEYLQGLRFGIQTHRRLSSLDYISSDTLESLELFKALETHCVFLLSSSPLNCIYVFIEKLEEQNMHIMIDLEYLVMPDGNYSLPSTGLLEIEFRDSSLPEGLIFAVSYYNSVSDEVIVIGIPLEAIINCPVSALAS